MNHKVKAFFCFFMSSCCHTLTAEEVRHPNIIVILADDIGYSDFGCYGATLIKTPAVDKLAKEGVRFTHAYAPASTSSPSRYALLTGEYAWRKNVGILPADAPLTIEQNKNTLPAFFQKKGYRTALIGKWHLGLGKQDNPVDFNKEIKDGPLTIGFDYAYYFPATNDRVPCVFIRNDKVDGANPNDPIEVSYKKKVGYDYTGKENPEKLSIKPHLGHDGTIVNGISRIGWMSGGKQARWKDEEMGERLLNEAKSYINEHTEKPFFLYFATHNAHEPRVPSAAFKGKSKAGIYGDMIEEFDYCVGQIVETLKLKGIYENTILIISSDNGPMVKEGYQDGAMERINGHNPFANLRGEKYSLYEGGTRVPFIFSWPKRIAVPFEQQQCFTYLDLLSTLSGLTNLEISLKECNDSKDGSRLFLQPDAPLYRDYIMTQNNGGEVTIRKANWKYIPPTSCKAPELYNLETDPSELHNLIISCPEQATELKQYIERDYKKELMKNLSSNK